MDTEAIIELMKRVIRLQWYEHAFRLGNLAAATRGESFYQSSAFVKFASSPEGREFYKHFEQ